MRPSRPRWEYPSEDRARDDHRGPLSPGGGCLRRGMVRALGIEPDVPVNRRRVRLLRQHLEHRRATARDRRASRRCARADRVDARLPGQKRGPTVTRYQLVRGEAPYTPSKSRSPQPQDQLLRRQHASEAHACSYRPRPLAEGEAASTRTSTGRNVTRGAEGDRTPDLRIANAALSQLSYCPGTSEGPRSYSARDSRQAEIARREPQSAATRRDVYCTSILPTSLRAPLSTNGMIRVSPAARIVTLPRTGDGSLVTRVRVISTT